MKKKMQAILLLPLSVWVKTLSAKPVLIYLFAAVLPSLVLGQNLDDFRVAAQNKGVQSIPFSSLRSDAGSIQGDINSWKQTTASFQEWKAYDRQKAENYKNIRLENETIKSRQDNINSLKSRNVDASQFEKELEGNYSKVKSYQQNIEAINYEVSKAVDAWDKLGKLRGKQREKFNDVLYKLSDAKSSPNPYLGSNPTPEDKAKLMGYIKDIEDGIKSEIAGHTDAEKACFNAKQNMESVLRRNSE
jgi:hypothetical protein